MSPEAAAALLDQELRQHSWYITTEVGVENDDTPVLFVYAKRFQAVKTDLIPLNETWKGYSVVIRTSGDIFPHRRILLD